MPTLHQIRLCGPWGCQPLARFSRDKAGNITESAADLPAAGRVTMPSTWAPVCGADFCGRVRFRRRFHWPARLTSRERVWLIFDGIRGNAEVWLDDHNLGRFPGAPPPRQFDITDILEPTNVLLVEVATPHEDLLEDPPAVGACGVTGEVRLEVRSIDREAL
jgi:hypothetical protein